MREPGRIVNVILKRMILEAIRDRRSCRTFRPDALPPDSLASAQELIRPSLAGPFGGRVRFTLVQSGPRGRARRRLGTYGFIKGAPSFLVGAIAPGEHAFEDYGWCMEKVVLELTLLGLGTCWLGGTFRRSVFAREIDLAGNELMPAVSPVGLPAGTKSAIDVLASAVSGARGRRRWEHLFLLDRAEAGPWAECLDAVRLAPSAVNGQPWRVARDGLAPVFHFYRVQTAGRPLHRVDMGIAMCHFELAAREIGLGGSWTVVGEGIDRPGLAYLASWVGYQS
jgi:nitroreductase